MEDEDRGNGGQALAMRESDWFDILVIVKNLLLAKKLITLFLMMINLCSYSTNDLVFI